MSDPSPSPDPIVSSESSPSPGSQIKSPGEGKKAQKKKSRFTTEGRRVGIVPQKGWALRNYQYLSNSLFPAMVRKREATGSETAPEFRELAPDQVEVVWIGHASFLVRTPTFNALIDPVWAKWMGPLKRHRDPGIDIEHLPPIDLILITHAHFDHLCRMSLKRIVDGSQTVIVPRGVGKVLRKLPVADLQEMTDWEDTEFRDSKIHFTPAHHWGARYIHDNHKGFGGYVIESPGHTVYHSGDSAYFDGFTEIGERYPLIDTALLPIGAYDCPSGREVHMNPEEAVQAFFDLGAKKMIPMHHATFPISNEHREEPLIRLQNEIQEREISDRVVAPGEGEQVILSSGRA
ncbi:MAG: MBL fold metallo-hydrolase [Verrucomicrobiales bacterium]|nr:MBL fold metallo-hydrolase [Verrucomicrobiales bacterium]